MERGRSISIKHPYLLLGTKANETGNVRLRLATLLDRSGPPTHRISLYSVISTHAALRDASARVRHRDFGPSVSIGVR